MPRLPVVILIVLLFSFEARADYHYASHTGTSTYPYTSWETAADSIQKAVDATDPHDTVFISSGHWYEAVAVEMYDSIAILGMGMDSTFWYSNTYRVANLTLDYNCSVEGITFERNRNWICLEARAYAGVEVDNCRFIKGAMGFQSDGNCTITNCIFDSCGTAISVPLWIGDYLIRNNLVIGCSYYWAFSLQVHSALVEKNIIINADANVDGMSSGRLAGRVVVRNNIVVHGIGGIVLDGTMVVNNTVSKIDKFGDGVAIAFSDSIINNSMTYCTYTTAGNADWPMVTNYNHLWGNGRNLGGVIIDSIGNIYDYPMFVNPDSNDFRLQAYSPLIDAGDPSILDVDGTRSDIGCYGGPGGCSYVYLDMAPKIPDSLSARVDSSGIHITWRNNYEADFNRYQVYRDTLTNFTPSVFNMIGEPDTSYFLDINISPGISYYYRFTSVDNQRNVSDHSTELAVYQTGMAWDEDGNLRPEYACIEKAYPNPFNQDVTIVYSVSNIGALPAPTELKIYDIQGRMVRTLVSGKKMPGTFRVVWDGKNDQGESVSSGNYIAKLYQWGIGAGDFPVKITLVR